METMTIQSSANTLYLVRQAVERERARLELALELARKRLKPFEQKYGVSSQTFMQEMAAEDLEGGDQEYVRWAGEFILMERLADKLAQLQEIRILD
ncbi:MAG TPA: hypothetical protein VI451_04610 [Anaerolineales bacterium]|jgi:hypothetical protein|nr:hypothetical protein [Anaerolineales bacterium]